MKKILLGFIFIALGALFAVLISGCASAERIENERTIQTSLMANAQVQAAIADRDARSAEAYARADIAQAGTDARIAELNLQYQLVAENNAQVLRELGQRQDNFERNLIMLTTILQDGDVDSKELQKALKEIQGNMKDPKSAYEKLLTAAWYGTAACIVLILIALCLLFYSRMKKYGT